LFTQFDFKVWINGEMFRLIRAIFQGNGHEVAIEMRRLKPKAPIIMLSAALDVPEQAMKLVDAFVAKDRLATQLLPAIAQLHRRGSTAQPSYDT
jgi:hypothetical protein